MKNIEDILKSTLSKHRYHHCLHVADLSARLAETHGWKPYLGYMAGLLHDSTKEWHPRKLIAYVKKYKLPVPDFDFIRKHNPNMLHGYVAAHYVKKMKWLTDPAALHAIQSHTLGGEPMGIPEMIVFIADFASKDRQYDSAKKVRRRAFKNLREAFRMAVSKKIRWNFEASKPVHPYTIKVWNDSLSS